MLINEMHEKISGNKRFMRLPEDERSSLIRKAVFIGEELADRVSFRFKTGDIYMITKELNILIERGKKGKFGTLDIFSTYDHHEKKITLYMDAISSSGAGKEAYFIGHELFHYYEKELKISQEFDGLNEISAHHFSSALLGM